MAEKTDIIIFGSGSFAARIAWDLAATAAEPTAVLIAGRNAGRLAWMRTAANARAHMFGRPVRVETRLADLAVEGAAAQLLSGTRPAVVVQAASLQSGAVIAGGGNAWTRLVAEGGLSATAVFQTILSVRVARAVKEHQPQCHYVNCCFPDVVNGLIAAMALPVTCGIGNIAILAHAFAGELGPGSTARLQVLAHYQNIAAWRRPPQERSGPNARVWIDGLELGDIYSSFAGVQLTAEPVIDISGASGVGLMLAMAHGRDWIGHVPGPAGLPGGYPVALKGGRLDLDLPAGLTRLDAISWNGRHEQTTGLAVDEHGNAHYAGRLHDALQRASPELAAGFHVRDVETVHAEMDKLRSRLLAQPG
jgi:hypothetical protein